MELEKKKTRPTKRVFNGPMIRYQSMSMPLIEDLDDKDKFKFEKFDELPPTGTDEEKMYCKKENYLKFQLFKFSSSSVGHGPSKPTENVKHAVNERSSHSRMILTKRCSRVVSQLQRKKNVAVKFVRSPGN
jgi:hypothetical protein